MKMPRIGVLVSGQGQGTNFGAIVDAIANGQLHTEVGLLIATKDAHGALQRAHDANIATLVLSPDKFSSSEEWDTCACDALRSAGVSAVCLAGYMRRISRIMLDAFPMRILNIHPSLLPAFGGQGMFGVRVHQAVIDHGCRVSGCTVHLLDDRYDGGPIVGQKCVPVEYDDTPESLAARVREAEHELYPQCIEWLVQDQLRLNGRRVVRT
ncbi:MAG: phosphoribosylglycinamide formyltransferase 1 [Abditibacteriota bacterium]|nr:phosphoribosylglycinamide formyltransferase 1 [Abditibacteriota bacterium]